MTKFQLILTGIFAASIVISVMAFAFFKGSSGDNAIDLTVWGTIDKITFNQIVEGLTLSDKTTLRINYEQKDPQNFDQDFIEALAANRGPDVLFIPHDRVLRHADKLTVIPFSSLSEADFRASYVAGARIFLTSKGSIAIPVFVDPLIMFYNRTLFTNAGLSLPPRNWESVYAITPILTKRDGALNLTQSAVSFGEFDNVNNAKAILSMLFLQAGSPVTERNLETDLVTSVLDAKGSSISPAESAVSFYTEFSNPSKSFYSWNRSMKNSQEAFIAGDLAIYFGFASEVPIIAQKNPNLNFEIAEVPQVADAKEKITFANFTGFAVPKNSTKIGPALAFVSILADNVNAPQIAKALSLPPVRNDLLANVPSDAYGTAIYRSALVSRAWLEPEASSVSTIFRNLIQSITSGVSRPSNAVSQADSELSLLLEKYNFSY